MIVVVGIGADGMAGLSHRRPGPNWPGPQSFTARRASSTCSTTRVTATPAGWPSPMLPALRTLLDGADGDVHVVASGDPLLHGVGSVLIRLFGPDAVDGAAARVVGDAGVRAGRLGGAGHRDHQPRHRRAAHRGAPRRSGRRAVARRRQPGRAGAAARPTPAAATPR